MKWNLFLPKIKQDKLLFSSYSKDQKLSLNDYGIPEPEHNDKILIDTRGIIEPALAKDVGLVFRGLGRGQ